MNNLPKLSYQARIEIRDRKHSAILRLLCDHEVFTSVSNVALLLSISESSARRALDQLVKEYLKSEVLYIDGHQFKIYGLDSRAILACDVAPDTPYFELGKVKSNFIRHKLEVQRIRIISEKMNGSFTSERKIRRNGLKKIPDGICQIYLNDNRVLGNTLMYEVEREVKTSKRYLEIIRHHLYSIEIENSADAVLYLFPQKYLAGATRLMQSIPHPDFPVSDYLKENRKYRFLIGTIECYPLGIKFLSGESVDFTSPALIPEELD
jgi:hypothetical protein